MTMRTKSRKEFVKIEFMSKQAGVSDHIRLLLFINYSRKCDGFEMKLSRVSGII